MKIYMQVPPLLLSLAICLFASCDKKNKNQALYEQAMVNNKITTNQVLVVPREGCGGCISEATAFLVKNKNRIKQNACVVFTGVGDYKLLKMQLGAAFIADTHVKIDSANLFLSPAISSSYPTLITVGKDKKVINVATFSTDDKKLVQQILNE